MMQDTTAEEVTPQEIAPLKHGADLRNLYPCNRTCAAFDRCPRAGEEERCVIERELVVERLAALTGLEHIEPAIHGAILLRYVWLEVIFARIVRWLGATPAVIMTEGGMDLQPAVARLPAMLNALGRVERDLGLTPAELRKLREKGETGPGAEFLRALRGAEELERQERANAQDADFTAEDADDEEADTDDQD